MGVGQIKCYTRSVVSLFLVLLLIGCARETSSERDLRREQRRNAAAAKREELKPIVGPYRGLITQASNGLVQNASLTLEIKEIPEQVEGDVDPVMVPVLTGYLRFNFDDGTGNEFIGFAVEKAEFDPLQKKLDLVLVNSTFKNILASLHYGEPELSGTWTAPGMASSGSVQLSKLGPSTIKPDEQIRGDYGGVLVRKASGLYHFGQLTVRTTYQPPQGLKVYATMKILMGDWDSTEYLTYRFDNVEFNPITGQFDLKSDTADVSVSGNLSKGELKGDWSSSYTGWLGQINFKKSTFPTPPISLVRSEPLRGTYQGSLKNTHPGAKLPERILMSFVTRQDLEKPNGISISGSMRLYLGPFGSLEYIEYEFVRVEYNYFTRQLTAKTERPNRFTIDKASVLNLEISGPLWEDAMGEVALIKLVKQ